MWLWQRGHACCSSSRISTNHDTGKHDKAESNGTDVFVQQQKLINRIVA